MAKTVKNNIKNNETAKNVSNKVAVSSNKETNKIVTPNKTSPKETISQHLAIGQSINLQNTFILVLGIAAFLLYANTLFNSFVLDDVMVLKDNLYVIQGIKAIPEIFSTPHMRGYLVIPNDLYRPFSLAVFALFYQFVGANAMVYHFLNILIYACGVITFFIFLHKFFYRKKIILAFIIALIFALHPLHTEVVANIKSSDELLCFLFAFLSLNSFMNYMEKGNALQLIFGIVSFFISILSKETVITFLAVIPVLFFLYKNEDRKKAFIITGSVLAVTAIFMVIRWQVLNAFDANKPNIPVEFVDNALSLAPNAVSKIATEILVMGLYLKQMVIPFPLISNYSFKSIPFVDFSNTQVILTILIYGALAYFLFMGIKKNKRDPWAFGILFYFATISLFSNFPFLMGAEMAERFAFFASAGICVLMGLAIDQWILKNSGSDILMLKKPIAIGVLAIICVPFTLITFFRNFDWQSNYTLYKADVEKSPNDGRLHYYYGTALAEGHYEAEPDTMKKKEIDKESEEHLRASLAICSEFVDYTEANAEIGRVFYRERQYDSAELHDKRALTVNPTHKTAMNNLGSVYLTTGKYIDAILLFRKVLNLDASYSFAYFNMARAWNQLKQYDSAIYYYSHSISFNPQNADAIQELGMAYYFKQNWDSANLYFKKVIALKPDDPNCTNNLGAIYLNTKNYLQAIEMFKKTLQLNPSYLNAYTNLGRSYYFSKQYQLAIETFFTELRLAPKSYGDIPYIALSYKNLGKRDSALKYEAIAKHFYADFSLNSN